MSLGSIGPYRLIAEIGRGGVGVVYRAEDADGSPVAIKRLHTESTERSVAERFLREASLRIEHPNVVRVLGSGVEPGGATYLVMELLEGETLRQAMSRGMTVPELLDAARQAALGLSAVHARSVVHRDIKPENLFRCRDGVVKVLDLGIAALTDGGSNLTATGVVVGTPDYLAPEQARGLRAIDARADVWALGVVLYEGMTHVSPFRRDGALATLLAAALDPAPAIDRIAPGFSPVLTQLVHRCLEKDPDRRFASMTELAAALASAPTTSAREQTSPAGDASAATPVLLRPEAKQHPLAIVLADSVVDAEMFRRAVVDEGGEHVALRSGHALGLFGGTLARGDEASRALAAATAAATSARCIAIALGDADSEGARSNVAAIHEAEEAARSAISGVVCGAKTARVFSLLYEVTALGPELFAIGPRITRTSDAGHELGPETLETEARRALETLVGPTSMPPVSITGNELLAPTLHASPGGAPADLLPGTILDGVYRVVREIGRGAMGTVYLVEHVRLGRKFAAKVVSARHLAGSEIGGRLENEARVASRVQHENIVDVTHLGQTASGSMFIVMELLSGSDLRALMQKQIERGGARWLPDSEVRALVHDVMAGLGAAHAAGIVHRDLKPENVFVEEIAGRSRAKIVDFGISRSPESENLGLTRDGQIVGTPLYMAPEQGRGGAPVDARADLYSLGVLCYELLTGALPFHATSVYQMIVLHATEPPPPIRRTRPDLSIAIEEVLLRALAKKPEDRFQSLEEMRDAWEAAWRVSAPSIEAALAPLVADPPVNAAVALVPEDDTPPVARTSTPRWTFLVAGVLGAILLASLALQLAPRPPPVTPPTRPSVTHEPIPPITPPPIPVGLEAPPLTQRVVASEPAGATVSILGREVGTTPYTVEVGASPVELELRLRGYRRELISITNDATDPVRVTLRRSREAPTLAPR